MNAQEMAEELATPISTLLAKGMTLPLYVSAIAANGAMMTGMFEAADGRVACEVWWTRQLPTLAPPIVVMYVDPTGRYHTFDLTGQGARHDFNAPRGA
jgi:hypothetical protein